MDRRPRSGRQLWWCAPLLVAAFTLCFQAGAGALVITEIMYHPPERGPNLEFVEVYNDSGTILNLAGHSFSSGIDYTFPEDTFLEGHSYLVVAASPAEIQAKYGITALGPFTGNLESSGETLEIVDGCGVLQSSVSYKDRGQWPVAPDGSGHTLSLLTPYHDPEKAESWAPSLQLFGTPGSVNFPPSEPYVEETTIIAVGEEWRYKKGTEEFSSPISAWRQVSFDDASWTPGVTGIGYGESYLTTLLPDMSNGYISFAARKNFTLTANQISPMETLILGIGYDDGFVAYLNGTEVARSPSMGGTPGVDVSYDTAAASHEGTPEEIFSFSKAPLVAGTNVLAIQVHNLSIGGSSDAALIPRLASRRTILPPSATAVPVVLNEVLGRTTDERWLELYNKSADPFALDGFHLTDDAGQLGKYTFPAGSEIGGHGFMVLTEAQLGFALQGPSVKLFLVRPDLSGVADAHLFRSPPSPDRMGLSDARFPDGADDWIYAWTPTRGAANIREVEEDVVVNEIMYNPFESRMAAGQPLDVRPGKYIELYNRGTATVSLDGWAFTKGIDFTFPAGTEIGPGEYLVIAEDPTYIRTTYGLPAEAVIGPWTELTTLSGKGETITLEDPIGNIADEVNYGTGGEWPGLPDGDGSSLELADPHQDNSFGTAWEASDESAKASWTQLSYAATFPSGIDSQIRFTPMKRSHFLLDDVDIIQGSTNYNPNRGFETDTNPWVMQGSMSHSARTTAEAHTGAACLDVIATSGADMRDNRLLIPTSPALPAASTTVRFYARWISGGNFILVNAFDNAMAHAFWLPVPRNLGTPGGENSATAKLRAGGDVNIGPAIAGVAQRPVQPAAGQAVKITVRISDADGVASAAVRYGQRNRLGTYSSAPLALDAAGGPDVYSGSLPGFNDGTLVVFYIEATDGAGVARTYPVDAPESTLLYQVAGPISTPFPLYRLSMDEESRAYLEGRQLQSDDRVYGTFVYDDSDIYYNVGMHYHGSPWNRPGWPRMFKLYFPGDKPFQEKRKVNISRYANPSGTSYGVLCELAAGYTIYRTGLPGAPSPVSDYRLIRWLVNGADMGQMGQIESIDKDFCERRFGPGGIVMKATGKITFHLDESWGLASWASLSWLGNNKESYRWNWDMQSRELEDNWDPLIGEGSDPVAGNMGLMKVIDAGQTPTLSVFMTKIRQILDVDEFMRVEALRVMNDDWDGVGVGNGQNTYFYYSIQDGRWKLIPWDMDHTFNNTGANLWPTTDPGINRLIAQPEFKRSYLRAVARSMSTTWNVAHMSKILDPIAAKGGDAIAPNGTLSRTNIKNFMTSRTVSINSILGTALTFRIRTNSGKDFVINNVNATLEGDAPLSVDKILMNGETIQPPPVGAPPVMSWTSQFVWRIIVPLPPDETSRFEFSSFDAEDNPVGFAAINVISAVNWATPTITSVEPNWGLPAGGTDVVIRGTGFRSGATVRFGTTQGTSVEVVSDEEIRVKSPAHATGTVDVKVTNLDLRVATRTGGFVYQGVKFVRGDADLSSAIGLSDVLEILQFLYRSGTLECMEAGDVNDDGRIDISDPLRILFYLYAGGVRPPLPFPTAGPDPYTLGTLTCEAGL
jgi:hypothetical protein